MRPSGLRLRLVQALSAEALFKPRVIQPDTHAILAVCVTAEERRMTEGEMIAYYVDRLRTAGAHNVDEYEARLRKNEPNVDRLNDFLSEAIAALMLLDYGAEVTMQDRPDLAVVLRGERFYAEVKHFKCKGQDNLNDQKERNARAFEFVCLEDATQTEGKSPYRQIADVATKKADQYREGEINVLIIDSDSETLHLMARSGAQEFSDDTQCKPPGSSFQRLNGIMLISSMIGVRGGPWNVDFAITRYPARRMSFRLLRALAEIKMSRIRAKL